MLVNTKVSFQHHRQGMVEILTFSSTSHHQQVPCSHADVFNSKLLSLIEKNIIKRFLTFCMNYDNQPEVYRGKLLCGSMKCVLVRCLILTGTVDVMWFFFFPKSYVFPLLSEWFGVDC